MVIKPLADRRIFIRIKFNLDSFQWFHIQHIISIIERRFFVIKWRKTHSFEVPTISFLPAHHNPHCAIIESTVHFI